MSDPDIKRRILTCATKLFARQGYGSTSVREVVEAAGVTKPTLYYYFDGKEGLFREALASKLLEGETLLQAASEAEGPVVERLRALFKAWLAGALADPDALRLMMTCSLPDSQGHPEVDVVGRQLRTLEPLERMVAQGQARGELRPDVDPHVAVMVLLGAMNAQIFGVMHGLPVQVDVVDVLIDTWLHGVSA